MAIHYPLSIYQVICFSMLTFLLPPSSTPSLLQLLTFLHVLIHTFLVTCKVIPFYNFKIYTCLTQCWNIQERIVLNVRIIDALA